MNLPMRRRLEEVCKVCGISEDIIIYFIEEEWIHPIDVDHKIFDEEDIARVRLIKELREDLGVNDEAVPIILNLIDQLNLLQSKFKSSNEL
jgi:chaperone modulatory protein CbpM